MHQGHQLKNAWNLARIASGNSSRFDFPLNPKSWPAPSTGNNRVFAGISLRAASISSIEPKGRACRAQTAWEPESAANAAYEAGRADSAHAKGRTAAAARLPASPQQE